MIFFVLLYGQKALPKLYMYEENQVYVYVFMIVKRSFCLKKKNDLFTK